MAHQNFLSSNNTNTWDLGSKTLFPRSLIQKTENKEVGNIVILGPYGGFDSGPVNN